MGEFVTEEGERDDMVVDGTDVTMVGGDDDKDKADERIPLDARWIVSTVGIRLIIHVLILIPPARPIKQLIKRIRAVDQ